MLRLSARLCILLALSTTVYSADHPDILNTCIDAQHHKITPQSVPNLYGECAPWSERACCERNSTEIFHKSEIWVGFTWNHCGDDHVLSDACRSWFLKDLCFYECSPNTGPWIVDHFIRIRNERYKYVPFCQSQCNAWWEACKNDFTCHDIWGKGFNYSTGINTCPTGKICKPFTEIYHNNATNFCEKIWDYSWKVVPDTQPCIRINFSGRNPNDGVTKYYADGIVG